MKIIKFGTKHCGMCHVMDKVLTNGNIPVDVDIVDAELNVDLADKHSIKSVPVTILFDGDKEIYRWNGIINEKEIINKIKEYESK